MSVANLIKKIKLNVIIKKKYTHITFVCEVSKIILMVEKDPTIKKKGGG